MHFARMRRGETASFMRDDVVRFFGFLFRDEGHAAFWAVTGMVHYDFGVHHTGVFLIWCGG
jgi:hypothetical protein